MELELVIIFKMLAILSGCFPYRFCSHLSCYKTEFVWLSHKYVDRS